MTNFEVRYKLCHVRHLEGINERPLMTYDMQHSRHDLNYEIANNCYNYRDMDKDKVAAFVPGDGYFVQEYLKRV